MDARVCELRNEELIGIEGEDAVAFLHAQLTSDVAGLAAPATQYSGYCSPKGRLLATFLVWRMGTALVLQLPLELREAIQSRLAKYVLRSRVKVTEASSRYAVFGVAGDGAREAIAALAGRAPEHMHEVVAADGFHVARLPVDRYAMLVERARADAIRAQLLSSAAVIDEAEWRALDIAAGIPVITPKTQDAYVPQMVNLDLIGGVSFAKGCYPGQEIVARMHYLGRLKQRMYRVRAAADAPLHAGDALFSAAFGPDQASGGVLVAVGAEALAVIQTAAVDAGPVHVGALHGTPLEMLPLPYTLPA